MGFQVLASAFYCLVERGCLLLEGLGPAIRVVPGQSLQVGGPQGGDWPLSSLQGLTIPNTFTNLKI